MENLEITQASLFSGLGGFDLAAEIMNWENVFTCEKDKFCRQILNHYWKEAAHYEDITKTDFTIHRGHIDVLTGGFPCQPYSTAGKREGKKDERHLWPEMLRAIREIQPGYVVAENVLGIVNWNEGLVFEEVQAELENEGYQVQAFVLPAASVNAPHRRYRTWFVAYSDLFANIRRSKRNESSSKKERLQKRDKIQLPNQSTNVWGFSTNSTSGGRCENNRERKPKLTNEIIKIDYWEKFPTQSPFCGGNDGLPSELDGITFSNWRNKSQSGYGNAIVPQVVLPIFKVIDQLIKEKQLPSSN